jgi:hypothetical protein
MNPREPGLKGNYEGSCVSCLRGTDTAVGLHGEAEWMIAFLVAKLHVPMDEAVTMFSVATGCDPGKAPRGEFAVRVTLCKECADKAGLEVGLQADEAIPGYQMPRTSDK